MTIDRLIPRNLIDHDGNVIESLFVDGCRTAVYSMRTADCPACRKHVKELAKAVGP